MAWSAGLSWVLHLLGSRVGVLSCGGAEVGSDGIEPDVPGDLVGGSVERRAWS